MKLTVFILVIVFIQIGESFSSETKRIRKVQPKQLKPADQKTDTSPTKVMTNTNSIALVPWIVPLIGSRYYNLRLLAELNLVKDHSILFSTNYRSNTCYDCSVPGTSQGIGVGSAYRFYFSLTNYNDLFLETGINLSKAKSKNTITGNEEEKMLIECSLVAGNRRVIKNSFFYEYGLGIMYRSKEITVDEYRGYIGGLRPQLHLALGYAF